MNDYAKLQSLAWLQQVPRRLTPELERIFDQISGKPLFFVFWGGGRSRWVRDMENARLSFVYVVQANPCLYAAETSQWAPAVVLSTTDPRASDPRWMERLGSEICPRLRSSEFPNIRALLDDEESTFELDLPPSSTGGVPIHLMSTYIDPERLPHGYISETRVLPALLHGQQWTLLPSKLYLDH